MIHDTHMHSWIPPTLIHYVTGTWADAAGQVGNTIVKKKSAASEHPTVTIPVTLPMNDGALKGAYLVSVDIYYEILTDALDAMSVLIHRVTLPANLAAIGTAESLAYTYDTTNQTAGNRLTVDQHTVTVTLDTAVWIEEDQVIQVQIALEADTTGVIDMIGARANYTLRL